MSFVSASLLALGLFLLAFLGSWITQNDATDDDKTDVNAVLFLMWIMDWRR